jgi:hypothetical protein
LFAKPFSIRSFQDFDVQLHAIAAVQLGDGGFDLRSKLLGRRFVNRHLPIFMACGPAARLADSQR